MHALQVKNPPSPSKIELHHLKSGGGISVTAETFYNAGNRISTINNLFDCFNFKPFGITLTAYGHLSSSHLE